MVEQYSILENVINILWLNYVKSRHIGLTFGSNSHWEFQIWVPGSQKFFIVQLVELFTNWKKKKHLNVPGVSVGSLLTGTSRRQKVAQYLLWHTLSKAVSKHVHGFVT